MTRNCPFEFECTKCKEKKYTDKQPEDGKICKMCIASTKEAQKRLKITQMREGLGMKSQ